ncbi:hypothetical protein H5410_064510 [Solanum commersonii]|uniref:Uncharacterized protein n=1 Tax=Solanum commersonii TaxID=4109 RepID=A0A9J5VZ78_SOLCO|nr:hypothetical protein H5410_064510 [Solanum commersonii]
MQSGQKKKNKRRNSKLLIKEGVDADDHVQQGVPDSMVNSSSLIDFIVVNERSEERSESKKEKGQHGSFEKEELEKQQQREGESDHTLMEESIDKLIKEIIPKSSKFDSLLDLCEVAIQNEITKERDGSKTTKDQEDSIQEKLQEDITGEPELNKVTGEDSLSNNPDHPLNENDVNPGSKLLTRDENDGTYRIMQGIPRSKIFRSISNLYKCTTSLSPVENEYNWNLRRGKDSWEDPNMNQEYFSMKKEDSSNKKNSGGKRKCRENQNCKGEKNDTT